MMRNRNIRIFLTSLVGTLCVLALLIGLAAVDLQCRRIGFGDEKTLIYQITGKNLTLSCNTPQLCYNIFVLQPK